MLEDLSDARRLAKPWLPSDDRDVTNNLVIPDSIPWDGRPVCITHGAMHRIDRDEHLYRCSECGVGARFYPTNSREAKRAFSQQWDRRVANAQRTLSVNH